MLTLLKNRSMSSQGHYLYIHCSSLVTDASGQVSLKSAKSVPEKKIFGGFYHIYSQGRCVEI